MKFLKAASSRLCIRCHEHPAKFRFRGRVKRDKDHTLCPRCHRSLADICRAWRVATEMPSRVFAYQSTTSFFRQALEQPVRKRDGVESSRAA
jgi:hypothetical protein